MNVYTESFLRPEPWTVDALCATTDAEMFFPEIGDNATAANAKKVCAACPVIAECREYAARTGQQSGIWAGVTARAIQKTERAKRERAA
ncbi:hypothetical protein GCM10009651_36010 [Microbacterium natoriense]|uniref:WhiB family transcriptional regulator n=1 Tax=Microbacterium natoriense TaxID=284570 RepID=UPI00337E5A45